MAVLEIVFINRNPDLSKEQCEKYWKDGAELLYKSPGLHASYCGFSPSHSDIFGAFNIWDSIHSHHNFQHSTEFVPFLRAIGPMIEGKVDIFHLEIFHHEAELKGVLESPLTKCSALPIAMDKGNAYLKWSREVAPAQLEKMHPKWRALWTGYTYEDPFSFYHILGWNNQQEHHDVRKTPEFAPYRADLRGFFDPKKNVVLYLFELKKYYGDW